MKIFITGATGFIGANLALKLANASNTVHALCRSPEKVKQIYHKNIKVIMGDITDTASLKKGMESCEQVYHLGALATVWAKDNQRYIDVNVVGTKNVLDIALEYGVKKVVVTSTTGVLGISQDGQILDEDSVRTMDFFYSYESSKFIMEHMTHYYVRRGLNLVLVNPSRVYGPGLSSQANSTTKMIKLYLNGVWRFIPGDCETINNYCFIDDVVDGHIKAMQKGRCGERYILGGVNVSYNELFAILAEVAKKKKSSMLHIPFGIIKCLAYFFAIFYKLFRIPPPITPEWVEKYSFSTSFSSGKAEKELGYRVTTLREGLSKTVTWLQNNNLL